MRMNQVPGTLSSDKSIFICMYDVCILTYCIHVYIYIHIDVFSVHRNGSQPRVIVREKKWDAHPSGDGWMGTCVALSQSTADQQTPRASPLYRGRCNT